ncbi:ABC transporter ATP-binding protein [Paeniglutamicibacter cryotolerans]|uniref:Branched-chain amino acid transport system ATP-binding protein n=1 Tax=Paeniglutamicibacter cryotolerans TaxID=670079 RepID=A0A839QHT3_9MICC|nr:ABC transporter ATP-binding protein [Paeniglutamicibacter cryotolerans]MBB2995739.1 branched-chain amino acid transport system ATP-binding protein [Paeniglutamicibacter cryotolerans]
MSTLKLTDVAVSRGAGPVISNVSLAVAPGEITALVGPNGAGKTSLLESISGVLAPSHGTLQLDGVDITRASRRKRFKAGIVHVEQGRAVFPSLTVRENLELTATTPAALEQVLEMFPELNKRIDSPTALLSGGEQQMVVLARAFAAGPKILLIDEMSLGLAPVVFLRLLPVVQTIAATGVGVLLVEQFAHLALKIADTAHVITGGMVSYSGPAAELVADPERLQTAYLG